MSRLFVILVLALALASGIGVAPANAIVWDLGSTFTSASNPDGNWSYMRMSYDGSSTLMVDHPWHYGDPPVGVEGWNGYYGNPFYGNVLKNYTGAAIDDGKTYWEANAMTITGFNHNGLGSARWTAPTAMDITINASFWGMDYNNEDPANHWTNVAVYMYKNFAPGVQTPFWTGTIDGFAGRVVNNYSDAAGSPTAVYSGTIHVLAGDKIDFAAAGRGDAGIYEHVGAQITITSQSIPDTATISGTVTDNTALHAPISGATVGTVGPGGVQTTATNSAGAYSVQVTPGVYTVFFRKLGYIDKSLTGNASTGNVVVNTSLDTGWDLASDFTNASNPAVPWSYGYATGSVYNESMWTAMPGNAHFSATSDDQIWYGIADPGFNGPTFFKNALLTTVEADTAYYGLRAYRQAKKVVANPSAKQNTFAVTRFTAPTSGNYKVQARFAGASPYTTYPGPTYLTATTAKVGLVSNGSPLLPMSQISGFAGRAENGYTDSVGTAGAVVYTYETTMDISKGDKIDAIVFNDIAWPAFDNNWNYVGPGWTQVDLTFTAGTTVLVGRVTSSLPGNPPVASARVVLNGSSDPWPNYETQTDTAGYYSMSVRPGTYDIEFSGSGYNPSPAGLTVVVPAEVTTTDNYQLTHSGTWILANDFSSLANPDGQWSYGSVYTTSGATAPVWQFEPYTAYGATAGGMGGWKGYVPFRPAGNDWLGWIGKNTTGAPATWLDYFGNVYVEKNSICFFGGDAWYTGGPAIRWTSPGPDSRVVKIDLTIASQRINGGDRCMSLFRNLTKMGEKHTDGFVGRAPTYADSTGTAPVATWQTTLVTNPGDTLEFALGQAETDIFTHWSPFAPSYDVSLTIGPAVGVQAVTSISAIKGLSVGTTVIMTTPVQLASPTVKARSFDKAYGGGTEYSFYVQNADRTQGIKCVTDGTISTYDSKYKVTFTGVVETQLGQKVVRVQSINSAVLATEPSPLGKSGKAVTNSGTFVKVWGKVTAVHTNPNLVVWYTDTNTGITYYKWDYDYITINDGSQDIKIAMGVQADYMSRLDPIIRDLALGRYIAVTGIAGTTTGTDVVVYPRNVYDIQDYTGM